MKSRDSALQAAWRILSAFAITAGAMCPAAESAARNLLRNGDFQQGARGWTLVDSEGNSGGEIVREPGGNQLLHGPRGRHLLGSLTGQGLDVQGIKELAGAKVTLSFRAKGGRFAHPAIRLRLEAGGKRQDVWFITRSRRYPIKRVPMKPEWTEVTRDRVLPPNIEEVYSLDVFEARGAEIYYDDLKLTAWSPKADTAAGPDPSWLSMSFDSGEELLEAANTCNFLLTEWARALSDLYSLRRTAHYLSDGGPDARVRAAEQAVWEYRDELTALRDLHIELFTKRFGDALRNPYSFYNSNDYTGRELMRRVRDRKSAKEPLVTFEKKLQRIRDEARRLQTELFRRACDQLGWTPAPVAEFERPEELFDRAGQATHIIFGARNKEHYSLFATQWLDPAITMHVDFKLDMDPPRFTNVERYANDLKPFKSRGWLRPLVIPLGGWHDDDFRAKAAAEPEEYLEYTENGVIYPTKGRVYRDGTRGPDKYHQFQFLNPEVMAALEEQYTAYSKLAKENGDIAATLMLVSELTFGGRDRNGRRIPAGYSPRFRKGFQALLAAKFGDTGRLNRAWDSGYESFADIALPTTAMFDAMEEKDIPLIYEYRKYRRHVYSTFFEKVYAALKRGSDFPVHTAVGRSFLNGSSLDPWDVLRIVKAADMDIHHHCYDGTPRQDAVNVYHQCLARYAGGKKSGSDEYYPTNPLGRTWSWKEDPFILFSHTAQNIWKDLASNYALLYPWWTYQHGRSQRAFRQGSYQFRSGFTLLEEYHSVMSHIQHRLKTGCHDAFFKTEKLVQNVGVIAPFDATMSCWPDASVMHEGFVTHNFLSACEREYEYVPEQLILSGEEDLKGFDVLLAPYTLWVQDKVQAKLIKWVDEGGALIAIGPYGYWDEYGRKSAKLIDACFGELPLRPKRGRTRWDFGLAESDLGALPSVKVESARAGQSRLISAAHGKGKVYVSVDTSLETLPVEANRILNDAMQEAAGPPTAYSVNRSFSLYTREDPETRERYLVAVNKDKRKRMEDTVSVLGEFAKPVDLGCPKGFPVPARTGIGCTTLPLSLAPGEGTILLLGKHGAKQMDRKIAVRVLRDRDRQAREKVLRVLDGIEPSGGESSYARAMVCRSLAQSMMMSNNFGPALMWSEKAADYARRPDPAPSGEAYECPRSRVPVAADGDDRDWDDVAWTGLGESRFKTKWDERSLCFLTELKDDEIINTALPPRLWSGDGLEIYLNVLNLGGRRALADLDFQYCFSSSGLAQVMRGSDTTASSSRVAVKPIDGGYRLEVAVPHRETMLAPVDGYELGFNLRHIGWGMKTIAPGKTGLRTDKEEILRDTGMAPYTNTFGWPKLRLTGGRRSLKPAAKYSKAEATITVRGLGCTLEGIARILNDPSVMRIDQEGALVNADIAVGDFSDLALTMNVRSRRKGTPTRMRAGTGSRIEARGDCDLLNVELSADAEGSLWSYGKSEVRLMREVRLTVKDRNGRPLPKLNVGVSGHDAEDDRVAFSHESVYLDANGTATFAAPAEVITVGAVCKHEKGRYRLAVQAKEIPGEYSPDEPVEPSRKTEYSVIFWHGYHEQGR